MRRQPPDEHVGLARAGRALEDRLAGAENRADVTAAPGVGEDEGGNICARSDEQLDLVLADLVVSGPDGELLDLGGELLQVVADELDQGAGGLGGRLDPVARELLADPPRQLTLRDLVDQDNALLCQRLREGSVLAEAFADEREHRLGRGRRQIFGDRLSIGGLPALDLVDEHEPTAGREQAHRVAGGDRVVACGVPRREPLDRVLAEALAQPAERALDLRPVAAGEQVGRLELVRHSRQA